MKTRKNTQALKAGDSVLFEIKKGGDSEFVEATVTQSHTRGTIVESYDILTYWLRPFKGVSPALIKPSKRAPTMYKSTSLDDQIAYTNEVAVDAIECAHEMLEDGNAEEANAFKEQSEMYSGIKYNLARVRKLREFGPIPEETLLEIQEVLEFQEDSVELAHRQQLIKVLFKRYNLLQEVSQSGIVEPVREEVANG